MTGAAQMWRFRGAALTTLAIIATFTVKTRCYSPPIIVAVAIAAWLLVATAWGVD